MSGLEQACVEGTRVLLLEMPVNYWSASLEETLLRMHSRGVELAFTRVVDKNRARGYWEE